MKQIKKVMFILLCILCVIFSTKLLWNVLTEAGYIPFNEEYDCRIYKKNYEQCEEYFALLMQDVDSYINNIPEEILCEYDRIVFSQSYAKGDIYIYKGDTLLKKQTELIFDEESIQKIEEKYNEVLIRIVYEKYNKEYSFDIGEYYRIIVSEEGVTVE